MHDDDSDDTVQVNMEFGAQGLDLNDPSTIEPCLMQGAQQMMQHPDADVRLAGISMKYQATAFACFMADAKRQEADKAATIMALCNNFAQLLSLIVAASSTNELQLMTATKQVSAAFLDSFISSVATNRNTEAHPNENTRPSPYAHSDDCPNHPRNRNKKLH